MAKDYIIYTEVFSVNDEKPVERYYYGVYTQDYANKIASELRNDYFVHHCVCKADEAKDFGIKNLPNYLR